MSLGEKIESMGLQFRNLVQHSDGQWSCRLMTPLKLGHKRVDEFWGDTASEAVDLAIEYLDSFDE